MRAEEEGGNAQVRLLIGKGVLSNVVGCESRVNTRPGREFEGIVSVETSMVLSVWVTMSRTKMEVTDANRSAKEETTE